MASVSLRHIQKIYPASEVKKRKKHSKNKDEKKKSNLKVTDKGVIAVNDFNIEIKDREFIVLVGPSGCGKSTTLRMIAGLEDISGGELYIDDTLMNDVAPKDRDIAMVFQSYALYPTMTVYDNIAFPLTMAKDKDGKKLSKEVIDEKVREAAKTLDITEYLDRKPKALSGGQRQRVAIGRAIVRQPKVLLMDEPLSNLDAKLRNQMRAEIIKLRQKIDTTFVYVTHDQTEAMTLGDRIVVMKDGEVQQIGTPSEIFNHPVNKFVAGFIGVPEMNFFDADLIKSGDSYSVKLGDYSVKISDEKAKHLRENSVDSMKVTLGVRPQNIELVFSDENSAQATVDVSEMMGAEVHIHLNREDRDMIIIVPSTDLKEIPSIGDPIKFKFSGEHLNLFDPNTDKNLEFLNDSVNPGEPV